ncbi:MAG: heme ABC transporter permease, partial [Gammaproteobacteria bacterium]|nr:heme ABC transporter permease [Gammaproteobacteria bacterium]
MEALKRLWHRLSSPRWFYDISDRWPLIFGVLSLIFLFSGLVWGLVFAPADYQQGDSFRIIYIHVPAALIAQSAYLIAASSGFVLLVWRLKLADMLLVSILPFGASMTALALFTGSVWGKPTWGSWW